MHYLADVDDDTRRAAERLDRLAERIKIVAAILGGLVLASAISLTLLYVALVLVARHIYGAEGPD
jgi:hypothetical protein